MDDAFLVEQLQTLDQRQRVLSDGAQLKPRVLALFQQLVQVQP